MKEPNLMETMKQISDFQKDAMTNMFNTFSKTSSINKDDLIKNMFTNPFEVFKTFSESSQDVINTSKDVLENNVRYHKAFIAYHQAINDMMSSISENVKILTENK